MTSTLGKLQRVDPRSIWKHEAHDFTPWLVDNIDILGEALGMELEVVDREADVGDFSVDILARDLGRDRLVVIENQLEVTDHSHLGQLITYAAGLEASVVIWVSRDFREEHRQALDWLNRGDGVTTEYFGIVIELLQIDDSKPAVNFRLVASPNNWSRQSKRGPGIDEVSGKRSSYQEFFQSLIDELREKHRFTNAKAGQPQNWYSFSSGTRGFTYGMSFAQSGELRAEVYIDLGDRATNEHVFDKLESQKEALEKEFGEPLRWERLDTRRACRVACYTTGSIEDPAEMQEQHRKWAVERLLRFKKVFGPRLPELAKAVHPAS
ncbi:DUF4268 domain-containing protein [Archangium violaceum]|uniref:DUF4268 domain-containing protein n=1 Tax=Archangium violaceum TaxID=83451 RepID=UPI001EF117AF|nr:DUF4268 domain-containing protein [Archangium violaceum]